MRADATPSQRPAPSLQALLWTCLVIGTTSFGGGLNAYVRLVFVTRRRWITEDEFLECLEVSRVMPGPNVINLVVMLSRTIRGPLGAVAGFLGLVLPAIAANAILVMFVLSREEGRTLTALLAGFGAAGAGLSVANAAQMGRVHVRRITDIGLATVAAVTVVVLKPPLLLVILVFGALGIGMHLRRARRDDASPR